MSKTITISDEMAVLLEKQRLLEGQETLDDAAELAIARGLVADDDNGFNSEELSALIAEADASGPTVPWDSAEFRAEVVRRYNASRSR